MTLTEFLTARLDEDEAVAREAVRLREQTEFMPGREPEVPDMALWPNDDVLGGAVVSMGPERVLAEVEAKRRIVDLTEHGCGDDYERVQRALAQPYADHPDYDEAWRP